MNTQMKPGVELRRETEPKGGAKVVAMESIKRRALATGCVSDLQGTFQNT